MLSHLDAVSLEDHVIRVRTELFTSIQVTKTWQKEKKSNRRRVK